MGAGVTDDDFIAVTKRLEAEVSALVTPEASFGAILYGVLCANVSRRLDALGADTDTNPMGTPKVPGSTLVIVDLDHAEDAVSSIEARLSVMEGRR